MCVGCGGASTEEPRSREERPALSLIEHLEQEIARDPVADGQVAVFDISPYLNGKKAPHELLPDLEYQLQTLTPANADFEFLPERQGSVDRLMDNIRAGFEMVRQRQLTDTEPDSNGRQERERQAIVDYFGGGTAFPLPNPTPVTAPPDDNCAFVSSHPSPTSAGYICVLFPQTRLALGSMVEDSLELSMREPFVQALNELDGDLAGRIVAHHELAHCLHDKRVPRSYTGSMTLRHTESVADVVAILMALRDERAQFAPPALADFRTLSAGLNARRGRNTAPAIEVATKEFSLLSEQAQEQLALANVSELTHWAEDISFESLRADYPESPGLNYRDQRDLYRIRGVRTKRVMRFARAALDGQATAADMRDIVGSEFTANDAALLLRIESVARRTLADGLAASLTLAVKECQKTWPDIFNQGQGR